ncbi:MAG: hypothetical protein A3B74_04640 [Candidatus Kerfeldbacteria bacterium RIFCSPHIGHO2_02_FULL_42_14]|uniref:DUF6922 domain-containing protein n=1 Tax=Candidatus Kerfeldbacteria bacterium RIFCSPHIGHO2_02_FULL_42_14 TaxID=1798540 RepID=A0A1G2ARM5_9BACT|nr:MAG: hypothetical protein A3B74_04640 [Candidatus Kerfeldbacteria bacterium RIFCSPHIGHO2_02_FULL_42_14]OGY81014.1 MAG: hypothetical protein A3E60_03360 [Candidatus Kerfeldbacteria bacterium RIFCSPHIGHO2_12_FULL_42_13]OGY84952.1 MAG: hypothetical protein A3I91_00515 [Candidatus Kerfeldbacteria bacterium RIFCSPLOWO2_02_FULL_42_19]OGY86119.1 MAG: hypothetical protein A3G01_02045 [Candidatus Kerfeldbacteria bacterium RIFCSPLOWO2_12_FULL_43_9]
MFKPLLWSFRWKDLDVTSDKDDIILNTINEGTLAHWRWIIDTYGKKTIRKTLEKRLASELHPESKNLARVVFDIKKFRYVR